MIRYGSRYLVRIFFSHQNKLFLFLVRKKYKKYQCFIQHQLRKLDFAQSDQSKDQRNYDYCNKARHTKEICWELHGRPTRDCVGRKCQPMRAQINLVEASEAPKTATVGAFSTEEIQSLKYILFQLNSSSIICASTMVKISLDAAQYTLSSESQILPERLCFLISSLSQKPPPAKNPSNLFLFCIIPAQGQFSSQAELRDWWLLLLVKESLIYSQ